MDNVGAPFYIEYRVFDVDQFEAGAAFGALRDQNRSRLRLLRAVVRLGDYKVDSFIGSGQGVSDILPLDNDELAIRHQIWMATDQAYKRAGEALAAKKSMLKQLNVEQPVDDFAKAEPVQSIGPVAKLDVDPAKWTKMLESATSVYKNDPQIQSLTASLSFIALSEYFVNTEGTVTRQGSTHYLIALSASEQAPDGMRLDRSPEYTSSRIEEMPTPEQFQADALKPGRQHEEAARGTRRRRRISGPGSFLQRCRGRHVFRSGCCPTFWGAGPRRGGPHEPQGSLRAAIKLACFRISFPWSMIRRWRHLRATVLAGATKWMTKAFQSAPLPWWTRGQLMNFLIGRLPIRDFPTSNGHGRASGSGNTGPARGIYSSERRKTSSP